MIASPAQISTPPSTALRHVGIVVIGRNEGERLRRCLDLAAGRTAAIVYVDSASTDGSATMARHNGAHVVELDMSIPFTAARARNTGYQRLLQLEPGVRFVQFLDGDCALFDGWLRRAASELEANPQLAAVCGRVRERNRDASIYNRLCDLEWNAAPVGDATSCGGNAMIRVDALRQIDGFNSDLIAGEEPELCLRLRQRGWIIRRLDADMVRHDAAMTRFGQWWKRAIRSGHAYAEGHALHGAGPQRHYRRETRSIWFWGLILPALAVGLAWPTRGLSLLLMLGHVALLAKVYRHKRRGGLSVSDARLYAAAVVVAKFPQTIGQLRYWRGRLLGRRSRVIEYKRPAVTARTIAYITGAFPLRSETFVYREIRALRSRGWIVHPVSLHAPPERATDLADLETGRLLVHGPHRWRTALAAVGECLRHPIRSMRTLVTALRDMFNPGEATSLSTRIKFLPQAIAAIGMARRLRRLGVRHLHCHFAHAPTTLGMYIAAQLRISFSFTGHANDLFQRRALLTRKLQRGAFTAAISNWHRELYRSAGGDVDVRCPVIRCGIDVRQWSPRRVNGVGPAMRVLAVCRLVEKKGIDTLLRAAAILRQRDARRRCLITVAGDGPLRDSLRNLATELRLGDDVRLLGAVSNDEVRSLLSETDVFALPCRVDAAGDRDGIPVVLMEAMACGVPVVCGNLPAIAELVEHDVSGLLVDGAEPKALADALSSLSDDASLRARLSAAARRRVEQEFDLHINIDRLEAALAGAMHLAPEAAR